MELADKTVAVTGAGSGIGRAVALLAAEKGARVACLDIRGDTAQATADTIAGGGTQAMAVGMDVVSSDDWSSAIEAVDAELGTIWTLANIAGITHPPDTVLEQTEEGWQRVVDISLKGTWLGMKAVIPQMRANGGGRIVNTASVAGIIGVRNLMSYSAAKSGIIGITRQAAIEYAQDGIRINCLTPGLIDTPLNENLTPEMYEYLQRATPVGRLGTPEEVASLYIYLASPGADFITGAAIAIDGGQLAI
jgi:NAD(P)-dependent dehydrogenase (short-subunit alcohol dehydrogenase family)